MWSRTRGAPVTLRRVTTVPSFHADLLVVLAHFPQQIKNPFPVRRTPFLSSRCSLPSADSSGSAITKVPAGCAPLHGATRVRWCLSTTLGGDPPSGSGPLNSSTKSPRYGRSVGSPPEITTPCTPSAACRSDPECLLTMHGGRFVAGSEAKWAAQITSADRTEIHIRREHPAECTARRRSPPPVAESVTLLMGSAAPTAFPTTTVPLRTLPRSRRDHSRPCGTDVSRGAPPGPSRSPPDPPRRRPGHVPIGPHQQLPYDDRSPALHGQPVLAGALFLRAAPA